MLSWETDLFAAHGLKHFFQLDSELLDVVEDDAGLKEENSYYTVSTSICYLQQRPPIQPMGDSAASGVERKI